MSKENFKISQELEYCLLSIVGANIPVSGYVFRAFIAIIKTSKLANEKQTSLKNQNRQKMESTESSDDDI